MGTEREQTPLVVIVGETASGKSALALELAERWNGEIIAADSRTVYRGMDIGTAKPSKADQTKVPHHLLDIVNPDEKFNVVNFQGRTLEIIQEIFNRDKLPIMVGGTGLYVDSILYDFSFRDTGAERDPQNPRHLKKLDSLSDTKVLRPNTLVIGLSIPKEELKERINKRVEAMIEQGLEREAKALGNKYGWDAEAMTAVGYREWQAYFAGQQTLEETKQLIITHTLQYAKRQRTWFKRNPGIHWFADSASALAFAENWVIENRNTGKKATIKTIL